MKDLISKVTFGFIMAQFLPGAMVVMAISSLISDIVPRTEEINDLLKVVALVCSYWADNPTRIIQFILASVALGMLIHGLNWTVLAWMENKENLDEPRYVCQSMGHKWPFWIQLIGSPVKMVVEVLSLLAAPNLDYLIMDENISAIKEEGVEQFLFLQGFYLYFGQFYAHTAYASLILFCCCSAGCVRSFTKERLLTSVICYFLTSILFLLGRIQLSSLFKAENELVQSK